MPLASLTATVLFVALELAERKSLPTLSVVALDASPVNAAAYTFENPNDALPNVNVLKEPKILKLLYLHVLVRRRQ